MKKYQSINIIVVLLFVSIFTAQAQEERNQGIIWSYLHGWEYGIKAGFNIGGTSPLPLPKEIRKIDSYAPGIAISIEGNATKWFDPKWGMTVGVRLENKNMTTEATVKNYGMKIINTNGGELQGLSYLIEGGFSGHVYNGHLRTPDQTGSRVVFSGESIATYDFSENLRKFQWGLQLGGEWRAFKHLNVYADLTWGMNDIFKKDFDTISFAMYPIYLNVGFGYAF